jgi:acetylornithine deacetylase/succinyl-diaminopimelate desuccinylase-like protein
MELALLRRMVSIPSVFPNEGELAELMYAQLQRLSFTVVKQYVDERRFNVLAEKGRGVKALMFYGHLDTVPLYGAWDTDPYMLTERGDQLFGLGTVDMKGGIFAILEAAKELEPPEGRKVKIALCVDEENESSGAYTLSQDAFLDDVQLVIAAEAGNGVSPATGNGIQPSSASTKSITLGRRGRVGITVSVPGISAHGATPERGVNAIPEAYTFIQALQNMPLPQHEKLGRGSQFIQEISAKSGSLSIPDRCDIYLSRFLVPPETPESALKEVQQYVDTLYAKGTVTPRQGKTATVTLAERSTPYYPPYITEEDNPQVKALLQRLSRHFDEVRISYGLSVADENIFGGLNKLPTVTLGPCGGNEHSANEWVSKRSLAQLITVYHDLMESLA